MRLSALVLFKASILLAIGTIGCAQAARAEAIDCLISRGNLCFNTGCDNSGKTQRITLDLSAGTLRLCPQRFSDVGCSEAPMTFDIRDNAILGVTLAGPETAARAIYLNRVTGALSASLLAAGLAGVDFGTCQIQR